MINPLIENCYPNECEAMISWLTNKPQYVWVKLVGDLNWDFAQSVHYWMINHSDCCKEVAAQVFALTCPCQLYWDEYEEGDWEKSNIVIALSVIERWREGKYHFGDFYFEPLDFNGEIKGLISFRDQNSESYPELDIPKSLLEFQPGKKEIILAPEHDPYKNSELWDLFKALGSSLGNRPSEKN